MVRKAIILCLTLLAIGGVIYSNQALKLEELRTDSLLIKDLQPVNAKILMPFLLGHEAFYADLFWIDTIQKSADNNKYDIFDYIYNMLQLITDLDPRFSEVYVWSSSALEFSNSKEYSHKEKIMKINEILEKGWNYMLRDVEGWNYYMAYWAIPQFLGYYYGTELKNREKALEYTGALMNIPGLPPYMKTWAAGLYRDTTEQSKGIGYLENLFAAETLQYQLSMADDELVKEKLKGKLMAFYKKIQSDSYGDQRLIEIQKRVRYVVNSWRTSYNFLPFEFYALLYQDANDLDAQQSRTIYRTFFPTLSQE